MRVLVVEDYRPVRDAVAQGLTEIGAEVSVAPDGEAAREAIQSSDFDVIVLDLMLPKVDGLSVLREMRDDGDSTMVLVLTAKDHVTDRVTGLDTGADDYLVKPFAFDELLARVRALYRRKHEVHTPILRVGDLEVDLRSRDARYDGTPLLLSPREYALLECLALRKGRVVSRDEIRVALYDVDAEPHSNVVDVYVGYLRRKLKTFGAERLIETRRGLGYTVRDPAG